MQPLWLCLRLPSLPLEALALPGDGPRAVFERHRQRRLLVCGNPAAEALGLAPGIELGAAAAFAPGAKKGTVTFSNDDASSFIGAGKGDCPLFCERNPRAEREALRALAGAAYAFSSQVTLQPAAPAPDGHALWLEIAGSLRLFGSHTALAAQLARTVAALGYRCEIGIAPTPEGAALLAGRAPALDRAALRQALAPLPIAALPVDAATRAALAGSGLRTLGEVLALPLDALARRFAPEFTDWLGRLTGRLPDARRPYRPPPLYRRRLEFEGEVDSSEALRFVVRRLLGELAADLVARDAGVAAFTLDLEHEGGTCSALEVGLAAPSRDPVHLQVLAQARLEQFRVPAPVRALVLRAERFAPVRTCQFDLFSTRSREEEEWQAVLDRLRARLGAAAVQGLGLRADHRPEKAWGQTRFSNPLKTKAGKAVSKTASGLSVAPMPAEADAGKPRPLWLLPEPRPLAAAPARLRGPERIEGGWWDGADVQRDYYVAETPAGARLWVYRDQPTGRWFLHGLWA
jgi:protein ImuB